ncbi:MAG TPA: lysophospholipase [Bacteroidales bacterium]|nr:lysophospholipase [Bacteroidales bacterium]HRR92499.1 lysophospholipase [Bacteroidales bacterium]HRT89033.1 lysophospholipase [Bacteroidales bacterium]
MDFSIRLKNGMQLRGFINSPGSQVKAFILLVHGIGDHTGRYVEWAARFTREDIGFLAVDLPGHGKSDGKRGVISSYDLTDEMINQLIAEYRKTYPGIPLFIYGHSLGGNIVLSYLLRTRPDVKGAVVTSPWLKLTFEPSPARVFLAKIMKSVFPSFVQPTALNTAHLSHDKEVVKKYTEDPLVHDKISAGLFHSAVSASGYVLSNISQLNVPLLLMHGTDDLITSPEGSREIAAKSDKITLRLWEGGYHELHNEPFRDEVFDYILKWINGKITDRN